MTPTKVRSGQTITGTTSEAAFDLEGPWSGDVPVVTLTLLTGTYQYTTVPASTVAPIIDGNYTTISTADDKKVVSFKPGVEQLRIIGTCTVHVSY